MCKKYIMSILTYIESDITHYVHAQFRWLLMGKLASLMLADQSQNHPENPD